MTEQSPLNPAPLKLGILGCGRIVTRRVLPAAPDCQTIQVHAIASKRTGVATATAEEFGIPHTFDNYDDLLHSDVDAIYVPCTGDQHSRWVIAAAKSGKHVLCEKPLAPSAREATEMVAACEEHGVLLQEAFMWRHHPRAALLKEMIAAGAIGQLHMINVNFSFNIDRKDWRLRPERGGGAMWDIGCYGVNASRFITSAEPVAISAAAHWWDTGVDMTMRIGLTFPNEILANIDCSFEAPFRCRMELVGDNGQIVVDAAFQPAESPSFQLCRSAERDAPIETIVAPTRDQYACQLDSFAAGIRTGRLIPPAENGLQNMRVMVEILETAKAARLVSTPIDDSDILGKRQV